MQKMTLTLAGRPIEVAVRRHRRAKRISLRLSAARDGVVMTLPLRASVEAGLRFFARQERWVLTHVQSADAVAFTHGAVLPLLGEPYTIHHTPGRGLTVLSAQDHQLQVFGDAAFTARRVRDFLMQHCRALCAEQAEMMAARIGKTIRSVKVRELQSRWGSCNARGNLTFNWRLIFAPRDVLHYLIAHEVAHLQEMNHSPRFWQLVASLCPHAKAARAWLKQEGHALHRFG